MRNKCLSALATVLLLSVHILSAQDLTATSTNAGINGGSIKLFINGGFSPYTFAWTGPNGYQATTQNINNLTVGQYCVNVKDALCGVATLCTNILSCPNITFDIQATTSCSGQSNGTLTVVNAPTNITYLWSNGSTNSSITGLSPGTYSVTVTDPNGCQGVKSGVVTSTAFSVRADEGLKALCSEGSPTGSITLRIDDPGDGSIPNPFPSPSGWYNYQWSNGATVPSLTGLSEGAYTVTITSKQNPSCAVIQTFNMINPFSQNVIVNYGEKSNPSYCDKRTNACDGKINLNVVQTDRPLNFSWSSSNGFSASSQNISNLCAGSYSVTVSDNNGCQKVLYQLPLCCCDSDWEPSSPPNINVHPLACTSPRGGQLQVLTVNLNPKSPNTTTSANGSINTSISGGTGTYTFRWTGPTVNGSNSENLSNLGAGSYCLTVNDGCSEITKCVELEYCSNVSINVTPQITQTCDCTISPDCNAGKIQLTSVTGGITPHKFDWSNGKKTKDIDNLSKGAYTLTVTTASGCSETKSFTVGAVATTFVLNSEDCRFYNEICPINSKVVKVKAKAAPTLGTRVNLETCFIEQVCLNEQGVPIEALVEVGETGVYNGRCVTIKYCKSISTGRLYTKSITDIGFTEERIGPSSNCGQSEVLYAVLCGGKIIGYRCKAQASPIETESIANKDSNMKSSIYLFDLLDSLKNDTNNSYFVPKNINSKTTIEEFEKLIAKIVTFNTEDLEDYRVLKMAKSNVSKPINDLKVFPNPFNHSFTIEIESQSIHKSVISIYNSLGQIIISNTHNLTMGKNVINIDARQLNESIYVVEVVDENGLRMTQKILKSNR